MEFHRISSIFPLMAEPERKALAEDIAAHGQVQEILLYEGQILDGRNRYLCCLDKGVEPKYAEKEFTGTDQEAIDQVISLNYHRRDLTASQKGMAAAKSIEMYAEAAKKRQKEGGEKGRKTQAKAGKNGLRPDGLKPTSIQSRDEAAKVMGTSSTSVERCRQVIAHGAPEVIEAVADNVLSAGAAEDFVRQHSKAEQKKLLSQTGLTVKQVIKEAQPPPPPVMISDTFYDSMQGLAQRIAGIRKQYGSLAAMFDSKIWGNNDTMFVVVLIEDLHHYFRDLDKEAKAYVKIHSKAVKSEPVKIELVTEVVKRINQMRAIVRKSSMGVTKQREDVLASLELAKNYVKYAKPYLES